MLRQPLISTQIQTVAAFNLIHIQEGQAAHLWTQGPLKEPPKDQKHPQHRPISLWHFRKVVKIMLWRPWSLIQIQYATSAYFIHIQGAHTAFLWPQGAPSDPQNDQKQSQNRCSYLEKWFYSCCGYPKFLSRPNLLVYLISSISREGMPHIFWPQGPPLGPQNNTKHPQNQGISLSTF